MRVALSVVVQCVVQRSDLVTARQLHGTGYYHEFLKVLGVEHFIGVPLPAAPGRVRVYLFDRGAGSGFSDTERMMLTLLQPHLYQIYKDAQRRHRTPIRLTGRQLEVLRCVALGMRNDEIAAHLVIAPGTVTKHLENIYQLLGVTSRTAAVARVFNDSDTEPSPIAT